MSQLLLRNSFGLKINAPTSPLSFIQPQVSHNEFVREERHCLATDSLWDALTFQGISVPIACPSPPPALICLTALGREKMSHQVRFS